MLKSSGLYSHRRFLKRSSFLPIDRSHKIQTRTRSVPATLESGAQFCTEMVRPEGFEPPTPWFVAKYSIQLSYGRTDW